jgi:hypothetical protein
MTFADLTPLNAVFDAYELLCILTVDAETHRNDDRVDSAASDLRGWPWRRHTEPRMPPGRFAVAVGTAVFVAGCIAGEHHATRTPPGPDAIGLGACPSSIAVATLRRPNADMPGITTRLVPIEATEVRVCKYATSVDRSDVGLAVDSRLLSSAFVTSADAAQFTDETNRLAPYKGRTGPSPPSFTTYVLTFANATKRVNVLDAVDAAPPRNGRFVAVATPQWQAQVSAFANGS